MAAKEAVITVDKPINISMHGYIRRVGSGASGYPGASARPTCQRNLKNFVITMGITTTGILVLAGIDSNGVDNAGIDGTNDFGIPNPANIPNPSDDNDHNHDDHHYNIPNPKVGKRTEELTRQNESRQTYHSSFIPYLLSGVYPYIFYHGSKRDTTFIPYQDFCSSFPNGAICVTPPVRYRPVGE